MRIDRRLLVFPIATGALLALLVGRLYVVQFGGARPTVVDSRTMTRSKSQPDALRRLWRKLKRAVGSGGGR